MKRVAASILLLAAALLISKLFAAELNDFTEQTKLISYYAPSQTYTVEPKQFDDNAFSSAGCPCDTPPSSPTITLLLIAAMAASLVMATFIYGSQFIATLVAG